nr:glycosyltransferase family 2 protein [Pirellula sp.]
MKASEIFGQPSVHHSSNLIANPRVSVILPTYCRGDSGLLQRSIESVLSQTMKSFELIILDDGSTDSSANVISKFVELDNRIIHVRFPYNSGLPAVRVNQGLLMARGSYCAYQFDDDQWTPQMLEVLVDGLDANPEFDVAHGKCLYQENGNTYELGGPYDYSKIVNANYIANNSLIHRKSVFERFGGYDMHLLMRRLCDWDLWLRWGKEVRFLFVNKPVSIVEAMVEGSLGKTVRLDCTSARYHMGTARNHKLTPETIPHYDIACLDHLSHLPEEYLQKLWARDILPFLSCRNLKTADHIRPGHKRYNVVTVKSHFDTTIDITINNFKELLSDQFEFTYFPQDQVDESVVDTADILLLNRTIDEHALELAKAAKQRNKAVAFFMDDDLLNFHELDASFSYLKPGTPSHNALQRIIKTADMVATYSDLMQKSVSPLNSKNVRLETNIRESHLVGVRSKLLDP